jgi:UDP:flavonoid glycosyltransferase YjiC (YdhE family)
MKFALASYGTRGDVEPCAAIGRELSRRGHEVRMAVPPDLIPFVEAAGLEAVAYGLDTQAPMDAQHRFYATLLRSLWRVPDLIRLWREVDDLVSQCWSRASTTLMSLADGADLLFTGLVFEQTAANVAEYYDIPLATLHYFPTRANGQLHPFLPSPLTRSATTMNEWLGWRRTKKVEDAQRRELGLSKATRPWAQRIAERGSLEIQAYDEVCFPGLAAEWAKWDGQRPFVGTLTMELDADADAEVASWIAAGTPPIYFGFGSMLVESPLKTFAMISEACAELGQRALICAGWSDFSGAPNPDHVKVVDAVNFAKVFPACRAVVHHGGAGTTAAALRAGVPALILWTDTDPIQSIYGAQVKKLKTGTSRRLSNATGESLVRDLRLILRPDYISRAREIASRMTTATASVARAADLLEENAASKCLTEH